MELSIIVPAYNEEGRLPHFLPTLISYSKEHLKDYEILVVDDGSTDKTAEIVEELAKDNPEVKLISYTPNRGKGWAVREGVMRSNGRNVLFIDADGSIHPNQIPPMLDKLSDYDVVVGTRRVDEAKVESPKIRRFIGFAFNKYVQTLYSFSHTDNLCGFKGFKRDVARDLFTDLIAHRWIFDVELYHKIRHLNYRMAELPINWVHKEGSKISLIDPMKMVVRLLKLRADLYVWEKKRAEAQPSTQPLEPETQEATSEPLASEASTVPESTSAKESVIESQN